MNPPLCFRDVQTKLERRNAKSEAIQMPENYRLFSYAFRYRAFATRRQPRRSLGNRRPIAEDANGVVYVLMWVDGYLSCETGDLTMDEEWLDEMASTIKEECSGNKDKKLMDIVKDLSEE